MPCKSHEALKGGKKYFCIVLHTKCPHLVLLKVYLLFMKDYDTGFCLQWEVLTIN